MRKDRDWVAGAHLRFSPEIRHDPKTQEAHTFGICRDLRDAEGQLYDTRQGMSFVAVFNIIAPSRSSAEHKARTKMSETISSYAGNICMSGLKVVHRDEVHEMLLAVKQHTWPEISQQLPEVAQQSYQVSEEQGQLAPVIPLFKLAEVVSIFSAIQGRHA